MKYPIEPGLGGVSREWLVRQIDRSPYPNMLLEVAMHPYYPCTLANFAFVTEEVLIDFLLGEDELTPSEFIGLHRGINIFLPVTREYLLLPKLQELNANKRKHRHKIARIMVRRVQIYECVCRATNVILKEKGLRPTAFLNSWRRFDEMAEEKKRTAQATKPRARKLPRNERRIDHDRN